MGEPRRCPAQLLDAIRVVAAGDALIAPSITRRLIGEFAARPDPSGTEERLSELTDRERDVLAEVFDFAATPGSITQWPAQEGSPLPRSP